MVALPVSCNILVGTDIFLSMLGGDIKVNTHHLILHFRLCFMSDMEMEKLWEKLYEEHLEQVSKKIKDIEKAEQEARLLTDEQVENMQ